jgi:hypothetical protein
MNKRGMNATKANIKNGKGGNESASRIPLARDRNVF